MSGMKCKFGFIIDKQQDECVQDLQARSVVLMQADKLEPPLFCEIMISVIYLCLHFKAFRVQAIFITALPIKNAHFYFFSPASDMWQLNLIVKLLEAVTQYAFLLFY